MQAHKNLSWFAKCQYCPRCRRMRLTFVNLHKKWFSCTNSWTCESFSSIIRWNLLCMTHWQQFRQMSWLLPQCFKYGLCTSHKVLFRCYKRPVYDCAFIQLSWQYFNKVILRCSLRLIRYDTRCYFNVRTEPTTKMCKKTEKTKSRKQICSEITVNSLGICRKGKF